jgi:hypothetical protein
MDDNQKQFDENRLEHKELMQEIKELSHNINELKVSIASLPEKFDERYGTKKLENWFYAGVSIVLVGIITGVLNLILK